MQESKVFVVVTLLVSGWLVGCEGEGSSQEENLCEGVDCSGHGTCRVENDEAVCDCEQGYHAEGLACVGGTDPCDGVDCSGHGTCRVENAGQAECRCNDGYHADGLECLADSDVCNGVACSDHGTCVAVEGEATCDCEDSYHAVEGLQCEPDAQNNPYLEPVEIPEYDPNDPSHCLIPDDYEWSEATLNSEACRHFYVRPGDYLNVGAVNITVSGTADERRTISLYNGNDKHPGKLDRSELAQFQLFFDNASYWTVDRQAQLSGGRAVVLCNGSSHDVVNRMYTSGIGTSVFICHESNANTIQQCRFEDMSLQARKHDVMCILMQHNPSGSPRDYVEIKDTKIIENEIVNQNDGLHVARNYSQSDPDVKQTGNMEGTIIDGNKIWVTPDIYVDTDGTPNPDGVRMYAENALDIKIGSSNPNKPMVISNNVFWGYRPACTTDSYLGSNGIALGTHFGVDNILVTGNVIFDSYGGFGSGDRRDAPYALQTSVVRDNLFVDCSNHRRLQYTAICIYADNGSHFTNNTIIRGENAPIMARHNTEATMSQHNIFIDTPPQEVTAPGTYEPNTSYTAQEAEAAGYTRDFVFQYDLYSNDPKTMTLEKVLK